MLDLQTIGVAFDTSGLEKGARALNDTEKAAHRAADGADKLTGGLGKLSGASNLAVMAAKALGGAFATWQIGGLVKDMAMLSARFETMGVVMKVAGNNAGYTMKEMEAFSKQLQKSGISMLQSRNSLTQLATANIDLANASKLARAAQDLAVVGNVNSSDALARMIHGIKSGEVEILRTLGLNVQFEAGYKTMAAQLGTTSEKLTAQQKTLARTNAALSEAARYQGIYEESMTTAGKAMTSLTRYWEDFKVKAGDAFLPALATAVFTLTDALKGMNSELEDAGQRGLISSVGGLLNGVLKTGLETVAVLAANVAFVLNAVGREIGGIAAQAAAVARFDFAGAAAIRGAMLQDSEAARTALDKFEKKVLSGGESVKAVSKITEAERIAAGQASKDAAAAAEKLAAANAKKADAAKKAAKEYEAATKAAGEYVVKLKEEAQEAGLSEQQVRMLTAAREAAKAPTAALRLEIMEQAVATEAVARANKEAEEAQKATTKAMEEYSEANRKGVAEAVVAAVEAEKKLATYGMLESAVQTLTLAHLTESRELAALAGEDVANIEKRIEAQKRLIAATAGLESKEAAEKQFKALNDEGKRFYEDLERGLTDSLFRAFESGKGFFKTLWDGIKNLFKTTVLKLAINGVVGGATNALGLTGGTAGQGGLMGMASNASSINSLWSAGSQFLTGGSAGASGASLGIANGVGALGGDAIGALATANGGWAGVSTGAALTEAYGAAVAVEAGTAAATAGAAGAATGITAAMAAVPVWGWAALAGVAILGMSGKGGGPKTESGGGYLFSESSGTNLGGPTADYARGVEQGFSSLAKQLGISSALSVGAFSSADPQGDSLTQLDVRAGINGQSIYNRESRLGGIENVGRSDAELQAAMTEEATRVMIVALKSSDLAQDYKDFLNTVSESATAAALESAVNKIIAVKGFKDAIEKLPFENLKNLSFAAADGLIAAAGGMEALSANLDTYYQNFYNAEEQRAQVIKTLFSTLGAAGVDARTLYNPTLAGFRALVDAQDVTTASGQKAYAALISVSGAFAQLVSSSGFATDAVAEAQNALKEAQKNAVKNAQDALKDALTTSISNLQELVDALGSAFENNTPSMSRLTAQRQIADALAKAQGGGGLPTAASLATALSTVSEPSEALFKTVVDWQRDQAKTANDLMGLSKLAEGQMTAEQKMLDALMGIDASVLSVADAIAGLSVALGVEREAKAATAAMAAQAAAAGLADAQAKQAIAAAQASAAALAAAQAAADAAARAAAYTPPPQLVPFDHGGGGDGGSFAIGTNFVPRDMKAQIHQGERIIPAADNRELMARLESPGGAELVAEVRALRQAVNSLLAPTQETARTSRKTADTLVRVTRDGDSILTEAA